MSKNGTEGICKYVVEGVDAVLEFIWTDSDSPTASFVIPDELCSAVRVSANTSKTSQKFCETVFGILH